MKPMHVIAGRLQRDYLLPPTGRPLLDVPGGNLLYAASGLAVWENDIGLMARVGEDYPHDWLRYCERLGWDTRGVRILPKHIDLRNFRAYLDTQTVQGNNPMAHFARLGLTFPKPLLGYQPPMEAEDDRQTAHPASPLPADIPSDYLEARAVHLCPLDFLSHSRLLPVFRQAGVPVLTLDPPDAYMTPPFLGDIRLLLQGLTAFLPSEEALRALFRNQSDDLWDMAEILASFGCQCIVIRCCGRGQLLYDGVSRKRWEVPNYPAHLVDPTGAGDSFGGGFLAGFRQTGDPLHAVLCGNVSASLTFEGSGAFHALEALPGLAKARLDSLEGLFRRA